MSDLLTTYIKQFSSHDKKAAALKETMLKQLDEGIAKMRAAEEELVDKIEIWRIREFKIKTEETRVYLGIDDIPELHDTVIESAQHLIVKCNEYRSRHIKE